MSLFTSQANPIRRTAPSLANPCYWGIRANSVHLSLAIEIKSPDPSQTGPINLGNPGEFTILQLAQQILAKTHSPSRIIFLPLPGDDPRQRQPDIALAQSALGWNPTVPLATGLDATIDYFQKLLLA